MNNDKKMDLGMEPIIDLIWEEEIVPIGSLSGSQILVNCTVANGPASCVPIILPTTACR